MAELSRTALWVGYGLMGRSLAISTSSQWINNVGVVDSSTVALRRAAEELHLADERLFTAIQLGLKRTSPQLVIINSPSEFHYAHAASALRSRAHVLLAKPVVSNLRQAERLMSLTKEYKRKVAVGQQIRFNRHYRAVAAFIASGELGRISHMYFLNSKPRPDPLNLARMTHPAMLEMSCHHFDALFALLPRAKPIAITARGYKPSWSRYFANSMVDACIDLTGGIQVLYHCGFDARAACYELRVEGSKGVLRVRGEHMSTANFTYELAPAFGNFSNVDLEAQIPSASAWSLFMEQWRHWLEGGKEPSFSLRNNLRVFALLQAGIEAVERCRPVNLWQHSKYRRLLEA